MFEKISIHMAIRNLPPIPLSPLPRSLEAAEKVRAERFRKLRVQQLRLADLWAGPIPPGARKGGEAAPEFP
jgi:hypothetical protein